MKPSRQRLVWLAVIVALVAGALWFARRPPAAQVVTPEVRDVVEVVVASGKLRAVRDTLVGAESAGIVESLAVREGSIVRKGDLLGRLTVGETGARLFGTKASLDVATKNLRAEEAALDKARQDYDRIRKLADAKLVSMSDLDRGAADVRVQEARTEAARAKLGEARAEIDRVNPDFGRREVRAPFDGVITQKNVDPGTPVTPSQGWFRIAEMATTEIEVDTDENNLGKLQVGQPVICFSPAYPDKPFRGRLKQIGPFVDSDRGVVRLKIVPETLPDFVLPSMTIDVSIEVRRVEKALALPVSAVSLRANPPYVLAVGDDGILVSRPVRVEGRNPDWAAIGDLPADTRVLLEVTAFKPGRKIRPEAPAPAAAAAAGKPAPR